MDIPFLSQLDDDVIGSLSYPAANSRKLGLVVLFLSITQHHGREWIVFNERQMPGGQILESWVIIIQLIVSVPVLCLTSLMDASPIWVRIYYDRIGLNLV